MDDITKAFADITPEDFLRETSAIDELKVSNQQNKAQFDEFVDGLVELTQHRATDSEFNPFAVLGSPIRRRIFLADGDETPDQWAARLRREANMMQATWFYVALLSPSRTYDKERPTSIDRSEEAINHALDAGLLDIGLCWLALRVDAQGSSNRAGVFYMDKSGQPSSSVEGEIDDEDNPFTNVLGGTRAL